MAQDEAAIRALLVGFMRNIPHGKTLGLRLEEITESGVVVRLPFSEAIVGNPVTRTVHGGAITSLLDQSCGVAVARALAPEFDITPTIDLRIDSLKPAQPDQDIYAVVTAYRVTRHIVFTRGFAYQDERDGPIANCVANFMRMGLQSMSFAKEGGS